MTKHIIIGNVDHLTKLKILTIGFDLIGLVWKGKKKKNGDVDVAPLAIGQWNN